MGARGGLDGEAVGDFERELSGEVVAPWHDAFDDARAIWNGAHDRRPAAIARCRNVADVRHALQFAQEKDLEVAVRGGAHSIPGFSTCDDGLVIDLSSMKRIDVDPQRRTAIAEAGVTWGEFDAATQRHGLAVTGGVVSSTGIAGFTLGGGVGWLTRKCGLACDSLRSAEIVLAGGEVITVDEQNNPELFWGLRGGGGNFGIVTAFEFDLHPVGPAVVAGPIFYPGERAEEILHFYRAFMQDVPDELTTLANLQTSGAPPFLPAEWHGKKLIALVGCYCGDLSEGEEATRPLRELGDPVADLMQARPYVEMQSFIDALRPRGIKAYMKSGYLREVDDELIATVVRGHQSVTSPASEIHVHHLGGAVARVDDQETAIGERQTQYLLNILALSNDSLDFDQHVRWTHELFKEAEPSMTEGAYINFLSAEGDQRVRDAYGARLARLQALKDRYDPSNVFHLNQNIPPSRIEVSSSS